MSEPTGTPSEGNNQPHSTRADYTPQVIAEMAGHGVRIPVTLLRRAA